MSPKPEDLTLRAVYVRGYAYYLDCPACPEDPLYGRKPVWTPVSPLNEPATFLYDLAKQHIREEHKEA